jgi:uncharacterized membrane protein
VVGSILPLERLEGDNRVNAWGVYLGQLGSHKITDGVSWVHPAVVCGYNRAIPRSDSTVLIQARPGGSPQEAGQGKSEIPLLVVSVCGEAKASAYLGDLTRNGCGGTVDCGRRHIVSRLAPTNWARNTSCL